MNKHLLLFIFLVVLASCGKKTEETKPFRQDITETVFASGILEADNTYNLTAQTEGYVTAIHFKEGDVVDKGKLLATIENKESTVNTSSATELLDIALKNTLETAPLLQQAQQNISLAKQKMQQDQEQAERYKRLWQSNSIAKIEYDNMLLNYETSKTNYENAIEHFNSLKQNAEQQVVSNKAQKNINTIAEAKNQVTAIAGGKVYQKFKQVGDYIRKGDVIATIGNHQVIYAKLNVDEGSISKVKIGQQAEVQINTQKDKVYKGTVYEILPSFDEASQSFIVKLKFTDTLDFEIIRTQLQANIIIETRKNVLLIPRNYLDYSGKVMIKGSKQPTIIVTKINSNEYVEVVSGITENDVLVTENIKDAGATKTSVNTKADKS